MRCVHAVHMPGRRAQVALPALAHHAGRRGAPERSRRRRRGGFSEAAARTQPVGAAAAGDACATHGRGVRRAGDAHARDHAAYGAAGTGGHRAAAASYTRTMAMPMAMPMPMPMPIVRPLCDASCAALSNALSNALAMQAGFELLRQEQDSRAECERWARRFAKLDRANGRAIQLEAVSGPTPPTHPPSPSPPPPPSRPPFRPPRPRQVGELLRGGQVEGACTFLKAAP